METRLRIKTSLIFSPNSLETQTDTHPRFNTIQLRYVMLIEFKLISYFQGNTVCYGALLLLNYEKMHKNILKFYILLWLLNSKRECKADGKKLLVMVSNEKTK